MNIYFSKVIKAGDRLREFNFSKLTNDQADSYHVDVNDDRGKRIFFSMYRTSEGRWKTSEEQLPSWVYNAELILGEAIEQNVR